MAADRLEFTNAFASFDSDEPHRMKDPEEEIEFNIENLRLLAMKSGPVEQWLTGWLEHTPNWIRSDESSFFIRMSESSPQAQKRSPA